MQSCESCIIVLFVGLMLLGSFYFLVGVGHFLDKLIEAGNCMYKLFEL